jgi:hypothetical protein
MRFVINENEKTDCRATAAKVAKKNQGKLLRQTFQGKIPSRPSHPSSTSREIGACRKKIGTGKPEKPSSANELLLQKHFSHDLSWGETNVEAPATFVPPDAAPFVRESPIRVN